MSDRKKPISVSFGTEGYTGLKITGNNLYEEFKYDLRWPWAGVVYQEMESNDPTVGAIMYITDMLIRRVDWSVEPASSKKADVKAAEFVEECMHDMSTSWQSFISEVLSMITYGFSFHEIVYKIRKGPYNPNSKYRSKFNDGKIGWKKMPIRGQNTLHGWEFADDGDVKAFIQQGPPDYKSVTIPLSKGLLFRTKIYKDNPEGKSALRNAYRPWYFKKRIEEVEGIGIERDLAGLPVLQAPEGLDIWDADDPDMVKVQSSALELLRNIRRDSEEGILLPFGWDFKLASTGSARSFDTNEIVNRYDNRIAITMLADIVLIGGEKTGSFALADAKKSMLASALEAHANTIADVVNKYAVEKLILVNNFKGITGMPKIKPGQIETPSVKELALLLRSMGIDLDKDKELSNFVRKVASMPKAPEHDVALKKETKPEGEGDDEDKKGDDRDDLKDTNEKDLEQNDLANGVK